MVILFAFMRAFGSIADIWEILEPQGYDENTLRLLCAENLIDM